MYSHKLPPHTNLSSQAEVALTRLGSGEGPKTISQVGVLLNERRRMSLNGFDKPGDKIQQLRGQYARGELSRVEYRHLVSIHSRKKKDSLSNL
jgi:hypothetical protein